MSLRRRNGRFFRRRDLVGGGGDTVTRVSFHAVRQAARNFLTNRVLVAQVEYLDEESANGKRARAEAPAQWPPMVDVTLFKAVCDKLGGHSCRSQGRRRRQKAIFPMRLVCAQCGGEYVGGRLSHAQGRARNYVHTKPKARMDEEGRAAFDAACCKTWYVDADEIETQVKNIIVQQRSDPSFESEMKALILERDDFRS